MDPMYEEVNLPNIIILQWLQIGPFSTQDKNYSTDRVHILHYYMTLKAHLRRKHTSICIGTQSPDTILAVAKISHMHGIFIRTLMDSPVSNTD